MRLFNAHSANLAFPFRFFIFLFVVVGSFLSCKRTAEDVVVNDTFNAAAAKEWYYGPFKKSPEWASSPVNGKKLPDWKYGVYRKVGSMEFVEFPLVKEVSKIALIGESGLSESDKKRLANSSLHRIVFVKKADGQVMVREVDYVPEWSYLNQKGFDISGIAMGQSDNDFSGRLFVRKWNGDELMKWNVKKGVVTSSIKIVTRKKNLMALHTNAASSSNSGCTQEVCYWKQHCVRFYSGDEFIKEECGVWELDYCEDEEVPCPDDDGDDPGPCAGLSAEECACQVYGIGCSGGGDDDDDDYIESKNISFEVEESNYTEDDAVYNADANGNVGYSPIKYSYHATVDRQRSTGLIVAIYIDPITADPMDGSYTDIYNRSVRRSLTLLAHSNYHSFLPATFAWINWKCDVHARYIYADGSVKTRQWTVQKSQFH